MDTTGYDTLSQHKALRHHMTNMFSGHRVLLVGCGGTTTDPHFKEVFALVEEITGRGTFRHVQLYSEKDFHAAALSNAVGVRPIAYGRYNQLGDILKHISSYKLSNPSSTESQLAQGSTHNNHPQGFGVDLGSSSRYVNRTEPSSKEARAEQPIFKPRKLIITPVRPPSQSLILYPCWGRD
jgi:hypothetical protein